MKEATATTRKATSDLWVKLVYNRTVISISLVTLPLYQWPKGSLGTAK